MAEKKTHTDLSKVKLFDPSLNLHSGTCLTQTFYPKHPTVVTQNYIPSTFVPQQSDLTRPSMRLGWPPAPLLPRSSSGFLTAWSTSRPASGIPFASDRNSTQMANGWKLNAIQPRPSKGGTLTWRRSWKICCPFPCTLWRSSSYLQP